MLFIISAGTTDDCLNTTWSLNSYRCSSWALTKMKLDASNDLAERSGNSSKILEIGRLSCVSCHRKEGRTVPRNFEDRRLKAP